MKAMSGAVSAIQSNVLAQNTMSTRITLPCLTAQTTDDTPLEIYGIDLELGMTVTISAGTLQCHTEATHEHAAAWSLAAIARRNSAGDSALISNVSGGSTSIGNSFPPPTNTRPKALFVDPSTNSHRFTLNIVGRAGATMQWQGSLEITIGRAQ